jgi:hypothetical protein
MTQGMDTIRMGNSPSSGDGYCTIHGWSFGEMCPYSLLCVPPVVLWIVVRLLLMLLIVVAGAISQLCLLLLGTLFCVTKVMAIPAIGEWFWSTWSPGYLETHPQAGPQDSMAIFNALILLEAFTECLPQLVIQLTNTFLVFGPDISACPPLTLLSLSLSLAMVSSIQPLLV